MTVTVKRLIKVATVGIPKPPPPPVEMVWRVQPTNTGAGGTFDPSPAVQVTDGRQGDVIRVSRYSGTCMGPSAESTTNASGYALFPFLGVGNVPGQGCRLVAENLTRPQIPAVISEPFDVLPLVPPWELISSASGYYNSGYAALGLNTEGSTLIVLAWGTISPPQLGFFTDTLGNIGWEMATVANLTMMWLLNPTNVSTGHFFIFQGINNATGSGMAFFGRNPSLISSANAFELPETSSIAAAAVAITNNRQLVVTGLGTGNVAPSNISSPLVGYVAQIQPPAIALDGGGIPLHGSGIAQKIGVSGTEEQPVWIGFPAGPMSTRTLLFEAGA